MDAAVLEQGGLGYFTLRPRRADLTALQRFLANLLERLEAIALANGNLVAPNDLGSWIPIRRSFPPMYCLASSLIVFQSKWVSWATSLIV